MHEFLRVNLCARTCFNLMGARTFNNSRKWVWTSTTMKTMKNEEMDKTESANRRKPNDLWKMTATNRKWCDDEIETHPNETFVCVECEFQISSYSQSIVRRITFKRWLHLHVSYSIFTNRKLILFSSLRRSSLRTFLVVVDRFLLLCSFCLIFIFTMNTVRCWSRMNLRLLKHVNPIILIQWVF